MVSITNITEKTPTHIFKKFNEDCRFLERDTMYSASSIAAFQRNLLPASSVRVMMDRAGSLKHWYTVIKLHGMISQKTALFSFWDKSNSLLICKGQIITCLTFLLEGVKKLDTVAGCVLFGTTWSSHTCMLDHRVKQHKQQSTST
jgi:hypothetical protein